MRSVVVAHWRRGLSEKPRWVSRELFAAAAAAEVVLAPAPRYLGVMASKKRFGEMRELFGGGHQADRWSQIKNPAGLDLGAELPEEIAVSILAEIVKERPRAAREESARPARPSTPSAR